MDVTLSVVQIILSVLLVITVLLQSTGTDLGGAIGGGSADTGMSTTRRGVEKVLFIASITLAILFAVSAVVSLLI